MEIFIAKVLFFVLEVAFYSLIKLIQICNKCYQCKLFFTSTMNEWCKILPMKTITEVDKT